MSVKVTPDVSFHYDFKIFDVDFVFSNQSLSQNLISILWFMCLKEIVKFK